MVQIRRTLAAVLLGTSVAVEALKVTFKNSCPHEVKLVSREGGNYTDAVKDIAIGGSSSKEFGKGFEGHFRHGNDDAATLVEFSTKGDMPFVWYDISVIPPRLNKGFEFCKSLDECKINSGSKKGYNVPVQVTPASSTNGNQCRELTCIEDGCTDAYLFPQDDTKTHACPLETDFTVTFCPTGSSNGGNTSPQPTTTTPSPTPSSATPTVSSAPTPSPSQSPAPTLAPTPTPTPSQTQTPTPTSAPTPTPAPTPSPPPTPTSAQTPTTETPLPSDNGKIHPSNEDASVPPTSAPTPAPTPTTPKPTAAAPTQAPASAATPVPAPTPASSKATKPTHCV